jgi:hypothetical protein
MMKTKFCLVALGICGAFAGSSFGQIPDDKLPVESDWLKPKSYHGQVVTEPNEGGLFRVAVEYPRLRVIPGKEQEYERVKNELIKQAARTEANSTSAAARMVLTRLKPGYYDRQHIANALGEASGASTAYQGLIHSMKDLVEEVMDTQIIIFHAAPQNRLQVRILKPNPAVAQPAANPRLPGFPGVLTDVKNGQRVMVKLESVPGDPAAKGQRLSIYKRWVTQVIVEEE